MSTEQELRGRAHELRILKESMHAPCIVTSTKETIFLSMSVSASLMEQTADLLFKLREQKQGMIRLYYELYESEFVAFEDYETVLENFWEFCGDDLSSLGISMCEVRDAIESIGTEVNE